MGTTIVLHYLEVDNYDPETWDDDGSFQTDGLPARCTADSPYFHIELEFAGGTAAGGPWLNFIIVDCIDQDLVGKEICCSSDVHDGFERCTYSARREWDDGFVSNAPLDAEGLPYREGGTPDGSGTPMGGEVIPDLDGMQFDVPDALLRAWTAWIDEDR